VKSVQYWAFATRGKVLCHLQLVLKAPAPDRCFMVRAFEASIARISTDLDRYSNLPLLLILPEAASRFSTSSSPPFGKY
jgi:hypothetical protein